MYTSHASTTLEGGQNVNTNTNINTTNTNTNTNNNTHMNRNSGRGRGRGRSTNGRGRGRGAGGRNGRGRSGRGTGRGKGTATATPTANSSNAPVCLFFLQNRCTRGLSCRFYHPPNANINTNNTNNHINTNYNNKNTNDPKKRVFDPYRFKAIQIAREAQDAEPRPYQNLQGPFYSMDIECVATGYGYSKSHRKPCRVALVKSITTASTTGEHKKEQTDVERLLDICVNLKDTDVISYMTELTGTTKEQCHGPDAKDLTEVRSMVQQLLPSNAVLVGHSIQHDIEWLGLVQGVDFKEYFDTSILFRQRIPRNIGSAGNELRRLAKEEEETCSGGVGDGGEREGIVPSLSSESNNNGSFDITNSTHSIMTQTRQKSDLEFPDDASLPIPTRYRVFSLRHSCINLLDIDMQENAHDPVMDAKYSLLLFHKYRKADATMLRAIRDSLHRSPVTASFASENPVVDGVVLSPLGYKMKASARFLWRWWMTVKHKTN